MKKILLITFILLFILTIVLFFINRTIHIPVDGTWENNGIRVQIIDIKDPDHHYIGIALKSIIESTGEEVGKTKFGQPLVEIWDFKSAKIKDGYIEIKDYRGDKVVNRLVKRENDQIIFYDVKTKKVIEKWNKVK
jgi:hypothetical protein